jgi:hypothetical protein
MERSCPKNQRYEAFKWIWLLQRKVAIIPYGLPQKTKNAMHIQLRIPFQLPDERGFLGLDIGAV